jgi:hypothetical protein
MIPFQINQGIKEIMDKISNDSDNKLQYIELVYYNDRLVCEIDRLYKCENMTGSEPAQQLECRRKINDIGHIIDIIAQKLTDKSVDNSSKSIGLQFSKLTSKLKQLNRQL